MSNMIQPEQAAFLYIKEYMCIYIYALPTINEKRSHELEREHSWVYGRVWREEREGEDVVIIL